MHCRLPSEKKRGKSQRAERRSNTRNGCATDSVCGLAEQRLYFWELRVNPTDHFICGMKLVFLGKGGQSGSEQRQDEIITARKKNPKSNLVG